jgi:transposase-like protein
MRCPRCETSLSVIKKGHFQRKNTPTEKHQRFLCKSCRSWFSQTSGSLDEGQKRPDLHHRIFMLLISGVSQRRAAKLCSTTQITVARKLVRMAKFSQAAQAARLSSMKKSVKTAVFDEMESFEHSKCKPVAIAVAVEEGSRIILSATAASMPAKGHLAAISRRRYGKRSDRRKHALGKALATISHVAAADLLVKSDQCPRYPKLVRKHLPGAEHKTFKGRRGCVVGQGELKAGGRDPLFSLNHTCAMVRDNVKCLSRRTWCTTKRVDRLQCRLDLYVGAHNVMIDLKHQGRGVQKVWPLGALAAAPRGAAM